MKTELGKGEVVSNSVVKETVKVKLKINNEEVMENFKITDVELVSGSYEGILNDDEIKIDVENKEDAMDIKNLLKDK